VLRPIAIWILAILLGMLFVLVGFSKLAGPSGTVWAARLSHWGYPAASRYAIGGIETLAGLGLLVPSIRRSAAITLIILMTGALITHLMHAEFIRLLPPLILGGLAYVLYAWQPRNIRRRHVHGEP
jgi:putative oxidoreductase